MSTQQCNKVKKELYFYIKNELTAEKKSELENHLKKCSVCQELLNDFSKTLRVVDNNPVKLPRKNWDYFASEILEKISSKKRFVLWKPALTFAFSLLVLVIGYRYFHQKKSEITAVSSETEELVTYLSNFDIPELYQ
ncbi:MAG: zf-HC2 domain-containing protein [Elusimicrobiota bacterium]